MNRRLLYVVAVAALALGAVYVWSNPAVLVTDYDRTTVEVEDGDTGERLATVDARVADTELKRYVGLSATDELGPDEGMLFVHDEPGEYAYVMRDMAFGIDIVFADADGEITAIYEAEPEDRPLTRYEGEGQYVLEVRIGYAADNGIEEGDRLVVDDDG